MSRCSLCGATTKVPVYERTVICELPHGHDGPHHGHIGEGPHYLVGPRSFDWPSQEAERKLKEALERISDPDTEDGLEEDQVRGIARLALADQGASDE